MSSSLHLINSQLAHQLAEGAIDCHCHGVGRFDFTEIENLDLNEIERILSHKKRQAILTLYLPKPNFDDFLKLMDSFHQSQANGLFTHIAGFALEGPLLASHGGTPEKGVWVPTADHWQKLASCGQQGLLYVILSPDAYLPGSNFSFNPEYPTIPWIAKTLLKGGVLPAPGHFIKTDPLGSAQLLQEILDVVEAWGQGPTLTDHLFNDMPHNFKHAWRTRTERARRDEELLALDLESWTLDNLDEKLGPVPATLIRNAHKGLVKVCQNFDGEHVDLTIVKKVVGLLGSKNMLMMTDSIESRTLAGRDLHMLEDSTLLYQNNGIVIAGTQNVLQQINNMFSIELSYQQIQQITALVPAQVLNQRKLTFNSSHA